MKLRKSTFLENYEIKCLIKNLNDLGIELEDIEIPEKGEYLMNIFSDSDILTIIKESGNYDLLHECEQLERPVYVRLSGKQLRQIDGLTKSNDNEFKGRSRSYVVRAAVDKFFE